MTAHCLLMVHDDVIKWKHFPRNWPFVRGIHRSPVNSPHKGQWRRALVFSLICVWINGWVNNRGVGDLRRHRAHFDVNVMYVTPPIPWRIMFTWMSDYIYVHEVTDGTHLIWALYCITLQWRHNEPHDYLLRRLFKDQRKLQSSSTTLAFVRGIWPMNSPHKGPVTRKLIPFDDVIMMQEIALLCLLSLLSALLPLRHYHHGFWLIWCHSNYQCNFYHHFIIFLLLFYCC